MPTLYKKLDLFKLTELLREPSMQDPFIHRFLRILETRREEDLTLVIVEVVKAMAKANQAYQDAIIQLTLKRPPAVPFRQGRNGQ